ncbi:MAG: hypothetical protein AAB546_03145, partial [Patescibacteria group bacterium]
MNNTSSVLSDETTVLVFAYALAGLGHLRVISALHDGLPPDVEPSLLGSHDKAIVNIHRITSVHPIVRRIYNWMEKGMFSNVFAFFYKRFLRTHTKVMYDQLTTILEQRVKEPKNIVVVAAHFGLAHQLVAVKEKLEKEKNIKIYLFVQVTDDTFHPMWYVDGAEIIVVPSLQSKLQFMDYAKKHSLSRSRIEVLPYPVNPTFFDNLTPEQLEDKKDQLSTNESPSGLPASSKINVSIPVSGAAVGTGFHDSFIKEIALLSPRFSFWVVSKRAKHTKSFLSKMANLPHVNLLVSESEREVVEYYDQLFSKNVISLEVTKPSEQAFKALAAPFQKAGVILLFNTPIGGQESDNLAFLQRHNLIPSDEQMGKLLEAFKKDEDPFLSLSLEIPKWRGLKLPGNPNESAKFVWWCLEKGVFTKMLSARAQAQIGDPNPHELDKNGVLRFWGLVT